MRGSWWSRLATSLAIEAAQLWIPNRSADVDDVLLNVVGAMLGYAHLQRAAPRVPDAAAERRPATDRRRI